MEVFLFHYFAPPIPDAVAGELQDFTSPWSASGSTCDGGGSTTYYTQTIFYPTNTRTNSPNVVINNHC